PPDMRSAAAGAPLRSLASDPGMEGLEAGANLFAEELGLLPAGEVSALGKLVVVNELGIRLLCPTPRRLVELVREGADGHRDLDALRREEGELVLPVEPGGRHPRIRQPEQRGVVEHIVGRQPFWNPIEAARDELETAPVVVDQEGG